MAAAAVALSLLSDYGLTAVLAHPGFSIRRRIALGVIYCLLALLAVLAAIRLGRGRGQVITPILFSIMVCVIMFLAAAGFNLNYHPPMFVWITHAMVVASTVLLIASYLHYGA